MPASCQPLAACYVAPPAAIPSIFHIASQDAVLFAATLATVGWLYVSRRQRLVARKQHTLNVMLQAYFNKEFRDAQAVMRPHILQGRCPDIIGQEGEERDSFRMVLNHYELLAAGIRNGDFDERMVRDSQRGTIVTAYEACENTIFQMRRDRRRMTTYEHFEWLYKRWEKSPPKWRQKVWEWIWGSPMAGHRVDPRA